MRTKHKKKHTQVNMRKSRNRSGLNNKVSYVDSYRGSISSSQIFESDMNVSVKFSKTHNILTFSDEYIDNLRQFAH